MEHVKFFLFFFPLFFFLSCFWHFFSLSALSLFCNCSRFVRFSQAFCSFPSFRSSIRCFQTKIKTNASSSFFARTTTRSDACAKRRAVVYIIVSSSREAALCVRVCERESKRARACDKTFLKRKKMYGKEIAQRERATKRRKKYVSFSRERVLQVPLHSTHPALSTCSTGPRRKVHTVRALLLDGRRVSERAFTLRRRRRENLRSRRLSNMYIAATDTLL